MSELRYGIIGTGMMGVEHIHNLLHVEGAEITALADPDRGSLDTASAIIPDAATFADHRGLVESGRCDAVVIASPNMTHVDVLDDVLRSDLHVLVEKPLCTTVDDCYAVIDLAQARDAITWVGLEYRYIPPVAKLISEVDSGAVGRPRMVAIREHRMPFLTKVGDWNRFSRNTGGTLVEKCCHFFDLMNRIMASPPVRVMASGAQDVNHIDEVYEGETPDILDNAYVIVEFEDGGRGMLDLCMFAEATRYTEELSVLGARGKVEALLPGNEFRAGRRGEHFYGGVDVEAIHDERIAYEGFHDGSSYIEHMHFRDAILGNSTPEVTLEDGLMSVIVGAAAHRSIDEARPVLIEEFLR
ncbi:MAG: myo-inositol 2-dehydrogenase/D-chiro-inositol 1-dehydrogenase [Candidatus Aldehydirespiratoraceae bacterium]|jgi:myo-inositol 2-dehydrogenase/D-chiro-inositol 1-dehydrogenase